MGIYNLIKVTACVLYIPTVWLNMNAYLAMHDLCLKLLAYIPQIAV